MALQSKTFSAKSSNGYTLKLVLTEKSTDSTANTSLVSYALTLTAGSYSFSQYRVGASISFDGTVIATRDRASTAQLSLSDGESVTLLSGDYAVTHNSDGTKSISAAYAIDMVSTSYTPGSLSGTGSMTLTNIPRASTIGATDAYVGSVSAITIAKKASSYSHSIAYKFGSLSGYITSSGDISDTESAFASASVALTVPVSWYTQIPNAKTGTCTLTCTTYSGTTQIGDPQIATFTVRTESAVCAPVVTGTVVDINEKTIALTGDSSKMVRYCSNALCTISAEAKHSASISSKSIGGNTVTTDTCTISGIESNMVAFKATDSRGYSTSVEKFFTLVEYIKLTNNATYSRTAGGDVTLTVQGSYFSGSFGAKNNALKVEYSFEGGDWIEMDAVTISGSNYTASAMLTGLNYLQTYSANIRVTDELSTVTKALAIKKAIPVFDWGENDFQFHVPAYLDSGAVAMGAYDTGVKVWVGSVQITPAEAGAVASAAVAFPASFFTTAPYVFVSPTTIYPDTVRASAYDVTINGATIYLHRQDTTKTSVRILAVGV